MLQRQSPELQRKVVVTSPGQCNSKGPTSWPRNQRRQVQADQGEPEQYCLSGERCDNEVAQWDSMLDEAKAGAGQCRTCPAVN